MPIKDRKRRAIIVLGMHRSGTSALAGVLGLLGARLPARLFPAGFDNPKGFFEPAHIVAIHDRLLAAAGTAWWGWEEIPQAWFVSEAGRAFVDELAEAVSEDYDTAELCVIKDPRMCRLMPLWYRVLERIDIKPCFAIPLRNPVEVAKSLQNRNELPLAHGCLLWLRHVLEAERQTRSHPRVFLRYSDLLAKPRTVIGRMRTGLGVAWPRPLKSNLGEIEEFLDPSLRTQIAQERDIDDMGDFSPWLRQAYECHEALVRSPTDRAARRQLDSLQAAFDASDAAFTPVFKHQTEQYGTELAALRETLAARQAELATLGPALAERDNRIVALGNTLDERDRKLAALDQALAEREAKIAALDQVLAERDAKVATPDQKLAERDAKVATLDQKLAERDRELRGLRDALTERDAKIAALGQKVVNLRSQLAGKIAELDRLFSSISWRLTSPLRKARVKLSHISSLRMQRVELRPLNQLEREAQAGSVVEWRMMGDDANFEIDLSRTGPLSSGHYRLIIELPKGLTGLKLPSLYVDSGNGLSETECLSLNFVGRGRTKIASFSLVKGARALRLDPSIQPGIIAIGRLWLRRMSRIEYYSRLSARLLRHRINSPADLARGVKRAIAAFAGGGPRRLAAELRGAVSRPVDPGGDYQHWIELYDTMTEMDKDAMRRRVQSLAWRPLISVIMPVHNAPEEAHLRKAIESVREQIYDNWEICIADDHSTAGHVRNVLDYYAKLDPNIRVCFRTINSGIAEASNSALAIAKGEFVALLDQDDELSPHALALVAEAIATQPDVDLIFSDEDKLDARGCRFDPFFKPDWNPSLMLSQNAFSHLGVYRKSLVDQAGRFRSEFDGSQDYDLVLRCAELTTPDKIRHIPHVLYHWRAITGSTVQSQSEKSYAVVSGQRTIQAALDRRGMTGTVEITPLNYYCIDYQVRAGSPEISIVMPSACKLNLVEPCLEKLLETSTYPNFEILLLVNEIRQHVPEQKAFLDRIGKNPRVRVLIYPDRPFNFSWLTNWGAQQARGNLLCLMNDDIEVITPDWLERMRARLDLPDVGAVGPMLIYPDDTIQHAGVILGGGGVAAHAHQFTRRDEIDCFGRGSLEQDFSCVTAACMLVHRDTFQGIGGFDEQLAVAFNDVDFCLRLRRAGWRIVWTPTVELYHHESASLGLHDSPERAAEFRKESQMMIDRWGAVLQADPCYNPNLSLVGGKLFELSFPPRCVAIAGNYAATSDVKTSLPWGESSP